MRNAKDDFKLSMLFGIPGVPNGVGCIKENANGEFADPLVQAAFLGFQEKTKSNDAHLQRFDKDRYIPIGAINQFKELVNGTRFASEEDIRLIFKSVLEVCGDLPVRS